MGLGLWSGKLDFWILLYYIILAYWAEEEKNENKQKKSRSYSVLVIIKIVGSISMKFVILDNLDNSTNSCV